jgi:hypothetical protein
MGHYEDGRVDCQNAKCPLYSFMPYRELDPDLELFRFNPKRVGLVPIEEKEKRELSEEEKAAFRAKITRSQTTPIE